MRHCLMQQGMLCNILGVSVNSAAFQQVYTGSKDETVRVWDVAMRVLQDAV